MAITNTNVGNGTPLAAAFDLVAGNPLDSRSTVASYNGLAALVDAGAVYVGMRVYVVNENKSYEYISYVENGTTKYGWTELSRIKVVDFVPDDSTPGNIGDILVVYKGA